jgi:hypothetical protein
MGVDVGLDLVNLPGVGCIYVDDKENICFKKYRFKKI